MSSSPTPALVGRESDLAALTAAARGEEPEATTWLVGGEAGVGKTRLVRELVRRADPTETLIVVGSCIHTAEGTLPFVAVSDALHHLAASDDSGIVRAMAHDVPELALLLPEIGAVEAEQSVTEEARLRLFTTVAHLLAAVGERRRVCLVLEDLHWADSSTRDLLAFLVVNLAGSPVSLIGTYRSDEMSRSHPFRAMLAELDRSPLVRHLTLEPFDTRELTEFARELMDEPPTSRIVDELVERSGGNAFYATEILEALAAGRHDVRPELRDLILARVDDLSDRARTVLRLAAVGGESVRDELLEIVVGGDDPDDLTGALREAIDARIVEMSDDGVIRFRHALLQEAVLASLLPRERQRAHARFAEALAGEARLASSPVSCDAELAWHYREAREFRCALEYAISAGRSSEALLAFREALGHVESALELWGEVVGDGETEGLMHQDALAWAAQLADLAADYPRAVAFRRAVIADSDGLPPEELAMLHVQLGRSLHNVGRSAEALQHYEHAVRLVPADPPSAHRAVVLSGLGQQLMLSGRSADAVQPLREAVEVARATGARHTEGHALNSLGAVTIGLGEYERGIDMLEAALQIAEEEQIDADRLRAYVNLTTGFSEIGDLDAAVRTGREGVALAEQLGQESGYGFFIASNLQEVYCSLGRWDDADRIERTLRRPESERSLFFGYLHLLVAEIQRGELAAAQQRQDSIERESLDTGDIDHVLSLQGGRAVLALQTGDPGVARDSAERAVQSADTISITMWLRLVAIRASALAVSMHDASEDWVASARRNLDATEHLADGRSFDDAPRLRGLLAESRAAVAELEGRDSRADRVEAVEAWRAGGFPWYLANALYELASVQLRSGDRHTARESLAEAGEIARRIAARPLADAIDDLNEHAGLTSDVERGASDPVLTERELAVLQLVAEGRTNRQIGEELFISPKTVSVHVSRILQKLRVDNRTEAAAAGRRAGLVLERR